MSRDIRLNVPVFCLTFTNKPYQLWSYSTEFHEIFTRYRGIICAVNAYIQITISRYFLEWQSDKCRMVGNFAPFLPLNSLPWQRPLRYRKNKVRLIICNSISTIRCKDCENQPSRSWDSLATSKQVQYDSNWMPWQCPLKNQTNWTGSKKLTQIPFIWWKNRENRSSRHLDSFAHSKK